MVKQLLIENDGYLIKYKNWWKKNIYKEKSFFKMLKQVFIKQQWMFNEMQKQRIFNKIQKRRRIYTKKNHSLKWWNKFW